MKSLILLSSLLLITSNLSAQGVSEVFNSSTTKMAFVGLDFSKVKLVGAEGFSEPEKIQSYYFEVWNTLMVSEMDKYYLNKAFSKKDLDYNVEVVEKGNSKVNHKTMITEKVPDAFEKKTLQSMVNSYNLKSVEADYGISFVVHSLNKNEKKAIIYVVIFDVKSKKVLVFDKSTGNAKGFGFRNYWAGAILEVIKDVKNSKFKKWKKEFG